MRICKCSRLILACSLCLVLVMLRPISSLGKEFYLAPNGSDSGDGNIDRPWHSLNYALNKYANDGVNARVQPGDTLYLRGGIYDITSMSKPERYYGPVIRMNTKPDSPRITIKSYPGEWAILDGGNDRPALEAKGKIYNVTFEDMEIRNCRPWGFRMGDGYEDRMVINCIFRNLYFHDNTDSNVNANPSGLNISAVNCIIEYCMFENNGTPGSSHYNSSNLLLFNDYDKYPESDPRHSNVVRYCVFVGSGAGIKDKGDMNLTSSTSPDTSNERLGNEIHHNIFKNPIGMAMAVISDFTRLHHNLVIGGTGGFRIYTYEMSNATVWYTKIYNNTFINLDKYAVAIDDEPHIYPEIYDARPYKAEIKNNVIYDCSSDAFIFWTGQDSRNYIVSSDYNFWRDNVSTVGRRQLDSAASMTVWRTYGYGAHSEIGPIRFMDSENNDYRLAIGSIGKNSGDDGNDVGAFGESNWYAQAGFKRGGAAQMTPSSPANLRRETE